MLPNDFKELNNQTCISINNIPHNYPLTLFVHQHWRKHTFWQILTRAVSIFSEIGNLCESRVEFQSSLKIK